MNVEETQEQNYQRTYKFLSDINGDNLPDYVVTGAADNAPWSVYLNNGSGFSSAAVSYGSMGPIRRRYVGSLGTPNPAQTNQDLFDFNGDGLPDIVSNTDYQATNPFNPALGEARTIYAVLNSSLDVVQYVHIDDLYCSETQFCPGIIPAGGGLVNALEVFLNNGHGFDPPVYSPFPGVNDFDPGLSGGYVRYSNSQGDVTQDFLDVTGDGLPDLVTTEDGGATWRVSVNVGSGRLADDSLEIPPGGPIGRSRPTLVLAGASGPIRDMRSSGTLQASEMQDWNGDGLPDRITGANGPWTLRPMESLFSTGATNRAWLMKRANDGVGGVFEVEFVPSTAFAHNGSDAVPDLPFPLWVVSASRQTDGTCTPGAVDVFDPVANTCISSGRERVLYYEYANGLYDWATKQFRGFGQVTQLDVFGSKTVNTFYQDEHRRGRLFRTEVRTPGDEYVVQSATNTWLAIPSSLGDGRTQVYLAESVTMRSDLLAQGLLTPSASSIAIGPLMRGAESPKHAVSVAPWTRECLHLARMRAPTSWRVKSTQLRSWQTRSQARFGCGSDPAACGRSTRQLTVPFSS
ncbi:MAG: VCBS repeat-containing protein [Deltaproteobacteria bacterium]|nr:VCBS repeat-containing protein [Deltaproteobacteria bacterium]